MEKLIQKWWDWQLFGLVLVAVVAFVLMYANIALADIGNLPGRDESAKLEAAGTLLRLIDTGLFKWGARLFAGLCIMSAAWALKEQRFGMAVICVLGAVIFGTAPTWVKNVFSISGESSIFGQVEFEETPQVVMLEENNTEGTYGSV
ncbi:MAG: hypothetical protein NTV34_10615 [Proteobacteria bacterium]|nr:hypothetical protein [Pseudomonadota bacterium]